MSIQCCLALHVWQGVSLNRSKDQAWLKYISMEKKRTSTDIKSIASLAYFNRWPSFDKGFHTRLELTIMWQDIMRLTLLHSLPSLIFILPNNPGPWYRARMTWICSRTVDHLPSTSSHSGRCTGSTKLEWVPCERRSSTKPSEIAGWNIGIVPF